MPAITDKFGRASIPTDKAVATTVKTTRAAGILVLEAFDLSKFSVDTPVFFVTYKKTTDPVTGVVSITNLVSWKGLVNSGANTITNLTVAPGFVDGGNAVGDFIECIPTSYWENSMIDGIFVGHNPDGSFKTAPLKTALGDDANLIQATAENLPNVVVPETGIWTPLTGLNGTMTAFTGYIDGYRNTVAAVASRTFTASKDTYIDVLRNISTNAFSLVYTEVANGAAAPALAANSFRLAVAITNGTTLTSFQDNGSIDNSGEIIYRTRYSKNINHQNVDVIPNQPATTSSSYVQVNGYSLPIRTKTGNLLVTMSLPLFVSSNNGQVAVLINGTYYDVINTSGANGLGITGSRIIRGLPKNVNLNPAMYFRIAGGATIALIQFRHMSWSVEEV